jgi:hypothetical protein
MIRGLPHLCKYMPRSKDARRLFSDPENEPNFDAISRRFPVPGCSDSPQEKAAAVPVATLSAAALPLAKIQRLMVGECALGPPLGTSSMDVSLSRNALLRNHSQQQLSVVSLELQLLQQELAKRQLQHDKSAALAAYAELLRGARGFPF